MRRWHLVFLFACLPVMLAACETNRDRLIVNTQDIVSQTDTPEIDKATEVPQPAATPVPMDVTTVTHDPPATCPVTLPPNPPFTPPTSIHGTWYGTDNLWTDLPDGGMWYGLPHNSKGYTQKVLWWRKGYSWTKEPEPPLSVTGRRLDAPAPPLNVSKATNAYAADIGSAMMVGVDFPTLGCWEITGRYADAELSFVVWVAP